MAHTIYHPWETLKKLSIPMWFFNQEDQKVHFNDSLREDLDLKEQWLDMNNLPLILHRDDWEILYQMVAMSKHHTPFPINYRVKKGEGFYWSKDEVTPYYDTDGEFLGYSGLSISAKASGVELGQWKNSIIEIGEAFTKYNGQSFFDFFVEYLADLLDVSTVLIGEVTGENKDHVTAISMYHKGITTSGFRYPIEGTPCAEIFHTYDCFFVQNIRKVYPNSEIFIDYGLDSYLGKALLNSDREVIGVLALMDERPQGNGPLGKALFQIFADRIENELSKLKTENQLRLLSQYDSLTGLMRRDYFTEILQNELKAAGETQEKLALLIIDLDNFKMINDSWGHEKGDELLRAFADHLQLLFTEKDYVLSRVSGDEFVVLLKGLSRVEEACAAAKQVIQSTTRPFIISQQEYYTTASVGVSFYPHDGKEGSEILQYANAAMHKAKRKGKNRFELYDAHMSQEVREEMYLKQALHHALDNQEFVLHYQPQVCAMTEETLGYEALLRWQQPDYGMLSPQYFIRLAEESGMIIPIGEWVLKEACRQLKQWQIKFSRTDLKVAVNLSARQFVDNQLSDKIFQALEDSDLSSESLIIEITETMVLHDFERSIDTLQQLRAFGIKIHLDDFGVGFSSLNYLSRLPVDAIKIDRSFISQIGLDGNDVAIVSAIIAMAKGLGLQIIAEGVEKEEHIKYLKGKGCFKYQGYYFSRPQPAEKVVL